MDHGGCQAIYSTRDVSRPLFRPKPWRGPASTNEVFWVQCCGAQIGNMNTELAFRACHERKIKSHSWLSRSAKKQFTHGGFPFFRQVSALRSGLPAGVPMQGLRACIELHQRSTWVTVMREWEEDHARCFAHLDFTNAHGQFYHKTLQALATQHRRIA